MKDCFDAQAFIHGECNFRCVSGCIRISPMRCGSLVQIHIHGLPCGLTRMGFFIELCSGRVPMPSLINTGGETLLSVYTNAFSPRELSGARVILTSDPSSCGCQSIACGYFQPYVKQNCCPPDPRPLFALPIRR